MLKSIRLVAFSFLGLLVFTSCSNETVTNATFEQHKKHFVDDLWLMYPGWATSVGFHDYDSVLTIPNAEQRKKELAFINEHLNLLHKYDKATLSESDQIDYQLIENYLEGSKWEIETFKSWEWNPSNYNVCGGFAEMLANEQLPLEKRLKNISERLEKVSDFYSAAKKNIKNPTIEHTQLSIAQNR